MNRQHLRKTIRLLIEQVLLETVTVSQFLKQEENKQKAKDLKPIVADFLQDSDITGENKVKVINWFVKELITQSVSPATAVPTLTNWSDNIGDWMVANINTIVSKLNTTDFTYEKAIEESEKWHEKLANKESNKLTGAVGRTVVSLDDIPGFEGWSWVALDKRFCALERDAMRHCGNVAGGSRDNILSLRDPNNIPHLTFINNQGTLGEMKGKGNSKPSPKYHQAIIKLLLSDEVATIKGGGYMPEKNFHFVDLTPEQQEQVKKAKPLIDNHEKFNKNKDAIVGNEKQKIINKLYKEIQQETNPENIKTKVKQIMDGVVIDKWDEKNKQNPDMLTNNTDDEYYEYQKQEKQNNKAKKQSMVDSFSVLLKEAYKQSKVLTDPEQFFSWMDKLITGMVSVYVEKDLETYNKLPDDYKASLRFNSRITLLDQVVHELYKTQPDVLHPAPKRNRFKSFKEYMANLRDYLDEDGVDLPDYKPQSNMISYEFIVKTGQEIAKQTRASGLYDLLAK